MERTVPAGHLGTRARRARASCRAVATVERRQVGSIVALQQRMQPRERPAPPPSAAHRQRVRTWNQRRARVPRVKPWQRRQGLQLDYGFLREAGTVLGESPGEKMRVRLGPAAQCQARWGTVQRRGSVGAYFDTGTAGPAARRADPT